MALDRWWLNREEKKAKSKRKDEAKKKEDYLGGRLIWCSAQMDGFGNKRVVQGTYVRAIHGHIGSGRDK